MRLPKLSEGSERRPKLRRSRRQVVPSTIFIFLNKGVCGGLCHTSADCRPGCTCAGNKCV